jgi:hypothetical protein
VCAREIPRPAGENAGLRDDAEGSATLKIFKLSLYSGNREDAASAAGACGMERDKGGSYQVEAYQSEAYQSQARLLYFII